ncbi:MAG: class I SAM-dependent methyltransferase [Deltaproteobacteria bacterium]|nr:class I SAM-dependent methyltransferase [Deltaproteobacteria bacterium]
MELSRLDRVAYRTQHLSFLLNATVLQETARLVTRTPRAAIDGDVLRALRRRHAELHASDLANVDAGLYPRELLFNIPLRDYARAFPALVRDTARIIRRKKANDWRDIPAVDRDRYPPYYRRTFHWQTDGYLSEHSAEIYELGVELLFRGTAQVMRRQVIPPVTRYLRETGRPPSHVRLLDVACGTGPTLRQLATTHPTLRYHGVDLSPHYVQTARRRLADVAELSLAVENAEALPYADGTFDVITCVYLFHELPRNARAKVAAEMFRVLRPGGIAVIEDSCQLDDSPELAPVLFNFPVEFHEPFYRDYLDDALADILTRAGFAAPTTETHLVAKVVYARKPA